MHHNLENPPVWSREAMGSVSLYGEQYPPAAQNLNPEIVKVSSKGFFKKYPGSSFKDDRGNRKPKDSGAASWSVRCQNTESQKRAVIGGWGESELWPEGGRRRRGPCGKAHQGGGIMWNRGLEGRGVGDYNMEGRTVRKTIFLGKNSMRELICLITPFCLPRLNCFLRGFFKGASLNLRIDLQVPQILNILVVTWWFEEGCWFCFCFCFCYFPRPLGLQLS